MKEGEIFEILYDTREPRPNWLIKHQKKLNIIVHRQYLDVGDFSITGFESEFMIERKTTADLVSSFIGEKKLLEGITTNRREQFRKMWERATQRVKILYVVGKVGDLIQGNFFSKMEVNPILASLVKWQQRYHYDWYWVDDEAQGQIFVYWHCREFLALKEEEKKNG